MTLKAQINADLIHRDDSYQWEFQAFMLTLHYFVMLRGPLRYALQIDTMDVLKVIGLGKGKPF